MSTIATSTPIAAAGVAAAMTSISRSAVMGAMMRPGIPPTTRIPTPHVTAIRIARPPRWVRSTEDDPHEHDDKAYREQAKEHLGT